MSRCVLASLLILFASGCAHLDSVSPLAGLEKSMIFQPSPSSADATAPFEDAWFTASDGTRLHGLFLPHYAPRAIALFCHGNAGNVVDRTETLLLLNRRHGLAVMTFDYRGDGRSKGRPSENGILKDARAARAWLARRTGVAEQDMVLMGRSLGGGVAVDLAAHDGAAGLVLASTFSSLPDVAAHHLPWMFPRALMTQRMDSAAKIKSYDGPLLQSHGAADTIIPIELGRKLFEEAAGPKQFIVIPGADHNDPQSEEYRIALDQFLSKLPRRQ